MPKDLRTKAFVLRRTNYGESDRILNFITPEGRVSAMAKGVRREKSKLAGNIEMFCLLDVVVHQGKNEFGVVTSAKMLEYFSQIVLDLPSLELGSMILKKINRLSESSDSPELFSLTEQCLRTINAKHPLDLIEAWFFLNFARVSGVEVNLHRDTDGKKLEPDQTYVWDVAEESLRPQIGGNIGANEIKLMRLMLSSDLALVINVKNTDSMLPSILYIAKAVNKA